MYNESLKLAIYRWRENHSEKWKKYHGQSEAARKTTKLISNCMYRENERV